MDVRFVLILCVQHWIATGVELDTTCDNTNCTQGKRFTGDAPFPCAILNKKGWETFQKRYALKESYGIVKQSMKMSPPQATEVELYKTVVRRNRVSPNLNISFSVPYVRDVEIKAVLMKVVGVAEGEVIDLYYLHHPIYLLFDFSQYKYTDIDQQHKRELFYQCIMGLDDRGRGTSKWIYNVILTAFTLNPEHPGISITYQLTSYNKKFDSTWKPGILTAVVPGTHNIHVVFERLPQSWIKFNTYYTLILVRTNDGSSTALIRLASKSNSYIFANNKTGTFYIQVLAHNCLWKKLCATGMSSNFMVKAGADFVLDGNLSPTSRTVHRNQSVIMTTETNTFQGTNTTALNILAEEVHQPLTVTTNSDKWPTFAMIGTIAGMFLTGLLAVSVYIRYRGHKRTVNLILACDHHPHHTEKKALEEFLQNSLNFNTTIDELSHESRKGIIQILMICKEVDTTKDGQEHRLFQLLKNDISFIIFAQNPDRLPHDILRAHYVFQWPLEVEKLLDFLCERCSGHNRCSWLTNGAIKYYRKRSEYKSLLNQLNYPLMAVGNNADMNVENVDQVDVLSDVRRESDLTEKRHVTEDEKKSCTNQIENMSMNVRAKAGTNTVSNKALKHVLLSHTRPDKGFIESDKSTENCMPSTTDISECNSSFYKKSRLQYRPCPLHGDKGSRYSSYFDSVPTTDRSDTYVNDQYSLSESSQEAVPFLDGPGYRSPDIYKKFLEINEDLQLKENI